MVRVIDNHIINNKIMEKVLESKLNDNFYIIDNTPSYTLKECLEKSSNKLLNLLYLNYHILTGNENRGVKMISRDKKIKFLLSNLPKRFKECFNSIIGNDMGVFEDVLLYKTTSTYNEMLLTNGFMFGFSNNIYVVPIEYLQIYKKNFSEKKKWQAVKKIVINYMQSYLLMNGIMPRKVLFDFIYNKHKLDITIEELDALAKAQNISIYKDYYNALNNDYDNLDLLIQAKQNFSYYYLEGNKLISYLDFFEYFFNQLNEILKDKDKVNLCLSIILISSLEDNFDDLVNELNLNNIEKARLEDLLDINWSRLRFWTLNGRTILSVKNELVFKEFVLDVFPKEETLENCLKSLTKEQYKNLLYLYEFDSDTSVSDLANLIIDNFKLNIFQYSYSYLYFLIASNHTLLKNDFFEYYDFTQGYIFVYKNEKNNKIIIPKEILDIMREYIK